MKIIFCCTGNICRSPMAEYICKQQLKDLGINDVQVESFGTDCLEGSKISENAKTALKEIGIEVADHKARQIKLEDVINVDFVFVMTRVHRNWLIVRWNGQGNVQLLGLYVGMGEVSDPYGKTYSDYIVCREQLIKMVKLMLDKVIKH